MLVVTDRMNQPGIYAPAQSLGAAGETGRHDFPPIEDRIQSCALEVPVYQGLDDSLPGCLAHHVAAAGSRAFAQFPESYISDEVRQAADKSTHPHPWSQVALAVLGIAYSQHRRLPLGFIVVAPARRCPGPSRVAIPMVQRPRRMHRPQIKKRHGSQPICGERTRGTIHPSQWTPG